MRQRLAERLDLYGLARFYRVAVGAVRQIPIKEDSPAKEGEKRPENRPEQAIGRAQANYPDSG